MYDMTVSSAFKTAWMLCKAYCPFNLLELSWRAHCVGSVTAGLLLLISMWTDGKTAYDDGEQIMHIVAFIASPIWLVPFMVVVAVASIIYMELPTLLFVLMAVVYTIVFVPLFLLERRKWKPKQRIEPGLSPICDSYLRASPESCPECCTPVSGETTPKILFQQYGTQLRLENDELVLNVLCGSIGQFGVEFALDAVEREAYKIRGDDYIKELDALVKEAPKSYGKRGRFC